MIWWFVILSLSTGAVLWVGVSAYLRVRRQLKENVSKGPASKE
jgi:hypothetical protein